MSPDLGSPEDGHLFEISAKLRGSYAVGQGPHEDAADWSHIPMAVFVRGWSLQEALEAAKALSFTDWFVEEHDHIYLSTSCLHDRHDYCQGETGAVGAKVPATCKFCPATCICDCHREGP